MDNTLRDIINISSGTMGTLVNEKNLSTLDNIQLAWVNWYSKHDNQSKNWKESWEKFKKTKEFQNSKKANNSNGISKVANYLKESHIDPFVDRFLDQIMERKPETLSDLKTLKLTYKTDGRVLNFIKKLPKLDEQIFKNVNDKYFIAMDFVKQVPQWFVVKVKDQYLLINTEGYNYARYVCKFMNYWVAKDYKG